MSVISVLPNGSLTSIPSVKDKTIIKNEQKELNITPVHKLDIPFETATFGMGCFWGAESLYGGTKGIIRTTVGYSGGTLDAPKYRSLGDHTEVLEIDYDPTIITYKQLLHIFWNNHEYGLTTPIKRQYMSLILYHNDEQKEIAEASKVAEQKLRVHDKVYTEISPAKTFWPAEDYHQKYRLQGHKDLCQSLGITNTKLLQTSFVGTKLNGFIAGISGVKGFLEEADKLGLTPSQIEYVRHYVEENEGRGLYC